MHRLAGLVAAMRAFGTAKELALAGGCHLDTAKRYRAGETLPDLPTAIRLMAASRAIRDAVLHAAGCDDVSLELETARLTRLLLELHERRAEAYARLEADEAALASDLARDRGGNAGPATETQRVLK